MDLARDSESHGPQRRSTCSAKLPPAPQRTSPCDGFFVYLPIYQEGEPREASVSAGGPSEGSSLDLSRATSCWMGSSRILRPADRFRSLRRRNTAPNTLLYDRDGIRRDEKKRNEFLIDEESHIEVAGREWTLYFTTLPAFEEGAERNLPPSYSPAAC